MAKQKDSTETTAAQIPAATSGSIRQLNALGFAQGFGDGFKGFDPPKSGTFDLYRKIEKHPTVNLALGKRQSQIVSNRWVWQVEAGVDEKFIAALKKHFMPIRGKLISDCLMALRRGFAPFEVIWEIIDGYAFPRLKPLRVDYTEFLVDSGGSVRGLRNKPPKSASVDLLEGKWFNFSFGGEADDPYGLPLLENIRAIWSESEQIRKKVSKYINKVSGVVGQIHYPDGTSRDASGTERPNYMIACKVAVDASEGKFLVFNNKFASFIDPNTGAMTAAAMEKALACAGKSEWVVSFVDPGGTDHSAGFDLIMRYYDALLVRGVNEAERALLEAMHGTRADASTHADIGVMFSQMVDGQIATAFNDGLLADTVERNIGSKYRRSVLVEPVPLMDPDADTKDKALNTMLGSVAIGETVAAKINVDEMIEDLGFTVNEDQRGPLTDVITLLPAGARTPKPASPNGNGNGTGAGGRMNGGG